MLFFQNLSVLSLFLVCLVLLFATPSYISKSKPSICNTTGLSLQTKISMVGASAVTNWKPVFKRSSYIGLVWKSQWKL